MIQPARHEAAGAAAPVGRARLAASITARVLDGQAVALHGPRGDQLAATIRRADGRKRVHDKAAPDSPRPSAPCPTHVLLHRRVLRNARA